MLPYNFKVQKFANLDKMSEICIRKPLKLERYEKIVYQSNEYCHSRGNSFPCFSCMGHV